MKGADRWYKNHRYVHSRWQRPESHSWRYLPSPLSRRRPSPRSHRAVMRPTGDPTAGTGPRIRATGITRNGVAAGTTASRTPAGCPCRLGAAAGLDPARWLVSPARLGSTAVVGRTLCRNTFRSFPPAALRVVHALSLPPNRAGSEPIEDRIDGVVADADAGAGQRIANAISLRSNPHSQALGSPAAAAVDSFPARVAMSEAVCRACC